MSGPSKPPPNKGSQWLWMGIGVVALVGIATFWLLRPKPAVQPPAPPQTIQPGPPRPPPVAGMELTPLRLDADPKAAAQVPTVQVTLTQVRAEATERYFRTLKEARAQFWAKQRECKAKNIFLNQGLPPAIGRFRGMMQQAAAEAMKQSGGQPETGIDPRLVAWQQNYAQTMDLLERRLSSAFGNYVECFHTLEQLDAQFPDIARSIDHDIHTSLAQEGL